MRAACYALMALASFAGPYILLYRHDPLAIFRRRASWDSVLSALGLPYRAKRGGGKARLAPLALGLALDALGALNRSPAQIAVGSMALLIYAVISRPVPLSPSEISLPYPREGRAVFERPPAASPSRDAREIDVSRIRMFYVSYRNGMIFSLPSGKRPLAQLIWSWLEQINGFAWVQIIYERAPIHRLLEARRQRLIAERLALERRGASPGRVQFADRVIRRIDDMLSSDLFAVAVRGIVIDADPHALVLDYSDDVDSLAVFGTRDPGLLYEMAMRRLSLRIPGSREEPGFFLASDVRPFVMPPAVPGRTVPAGLGVLAGFSGQEAQGEEVLELDPIPSIDEGFHVPARGVIELVQDGRVHFLAGLELGRALALRAPAFSYSPIEAFKRQLENLT
ncbi:MAG: hypothetical protein ACP5GH_06685 [Nitrososphaeria archaeon]